MLPFLPDPIRWVIFTNEERAVLMEAFNNMSLTPKEAAAPFDWKRYPETSENSERRSNDAKVENLLAIRSKLVRSLSNGPQAVLSLGEEDRAALSALVMQEIAGYYDFQMSIAEKMDSAGVEFIPVEDDRQKARLRIFSRLHA